VHLLSALSQARRDHQGESVASVAVDSVPATRDKITGTATGYHDLDELLSGLQPSTLNIVGARPAVGKTAFALGIAVHVAQTTGKPVLVFSLEMSHDQLTERIMSSEAKVDRRRIRNGRLTESEWAKVGRAIGRLEVPLILDDNPHLTVTGIGQKARGLKDRHGGLSLIVVDYLQLLASAGNPDERPLTISEIGLSLKILARELQVPIIALTQLDWQLEARTDKRPTLSDLHETSSLEQDADVVLFLYRDELYYPESPDKGSAEVIVAKHRAGPIGTTRLAYLSPYTRFDNIARTV
jgi:replicative DNA helicase